MMPRKVMGALFAGAMGATPVFGDVFATSIEQQLQSQGFKSISRERTWLGRTRIVAENDDGQREIIVNPNNGEILRDLWLVERRSEQDSRSEQDKGNGNGRAGSDGGISVGGGKPAVSGGDIAKEEKPVGGDGQVKTDDGQSGKPKATDWNKGDKSGDQEWDKSDAGGWKNDGKGEVKTE